MRVNKCFVQREENAEGKVHGGLLQINKHPVLAALTTLSSALSLVFKTLPRSLVVETFGINWVLDGLWFMMM